MAAPKDQSCSSKGIEMRFFRRTLAEHRRLPRLVRIFRVWQGASVAVIILLLLVGLIFRLPVPPMDLLMAAPLIVLSVSVVGVGLLTWRNYERTAEIWAENVRGRGLESAGVGWLMDTGTARAIGAGKAIFMTLFAATALIQAIWR